MIIIRKKYLSLSLYRYYSNETVISLADFESDDFLNQIPLKKEVSVNIKTFNVHICNFSGLQNLTWNIFKDEMEKILLLVSNNYTSSDKVLVKIHYVVNKINTYNVINNNDRENFDNCIKEVEILEKNLKAFKLPFKNKEKEIIQLSLTRISNTIKGVYKNSLVLENKTLTFDHMENSFKRALDYFSIKNKNVSLSSENVSSNVVKVFTLDKNYILNDTDYFINCNYESIMTARSVEPVEPKANEKKTIKVKVSKKINKYQTGENATEATEAFKNDK